MVVFTGTCSAQSDVNIERVFEVATDPALLERWTIGAFENIRLMGAASFGAGTRFHADDFLAEGTKDRNHMYQVVRYEPPTAFAWRCIDGPQYTAELRLLGQNGTTDRLVTYRCSIDSDRSDNGGTHALPHNPGYSAAGRA